MAANEFQVSDEFLNQNLEHAKIKRPVKKGGPYSKHDRDKRRDEVYRLHFDYGYPARKIADLMNISRHTINGDIDYWYSIILKNNNIYQPESRIFLNLVQMDIQLTRQRERLDKAKTHSEQMDIEHLIFKITSKSVDTHMKFANSAFNIHNVAKGWYDDYIKSGKIHQPFSLYDFVLVSPKARKKIRKIIKEDELKRNLKKKF